MRTVETFLYRVRYAAAAVGLLLIIYCQTYLLMAAPLELGFGFLWQPDNQLKVVSVESEHVSASQLAVGDFIIAVDGRTLQQTTPIFEPPIRSSYELTVMRGGETFTMPLALPTTRSIGITAMTVVSLLSWAIGLLLLTYRVHTDRNAFRLGMIFVFLGTLLSTIMASVWGVPGIWISHGATHYSFFAFVMLGLLPRRDGFGRKQKIALQVLFAISTLLAAIGLFEVLFLFPRGRSLMMITGISLVRSSYLALAAGMLTALVLLVVRWIQTVAARRRQLTILLFFVGIGTLPAVLLTIVPQILGGRMIVSSLLTFSLLLFVPLGYLFVVFRQGYLKLDFYFGRILVGVLLALSVFTVYSTLWDLLNQRYGTLPADGQAAFAVCIFIVAILLAVPLRKTIQTIFYGQERLTQQTIDSIVTDISEHPHRDTLQQAVEQITAHINVERAALLLDMGEANWSEVARVNVDSAEITSTKSLATFTTPMLRARDDHALFGRFEWSELLVPVVLGGKQIGVWLLSNPLPEEAYDSRLTEKLVRIASTIAVSSRTIQLFESTNQIAGRLLHRHTRQQHLLASHIHDFPLANAMSSLNLLSRSFKVDNSEAFVKQAIDNMQSVVDDLRNVCHGLRVDAFDQGLDTLTKDVIADVCRTLPDLSVSRQLADDLITAQASETTKMAFVHILREALNNAARHAQAGQIWVAVECNEQTLQLEVHDDGQGGATIAQARTNLMPSEGHYGLYSMQRWAQLAKGLLSIDGNRQGGVTVKAQLSLQS